MNSDYYSVVLDGGLTGCAARLSIRTCPICGKEFECFGEKTWAYKKGHPKKHKIDYVYFCSWKCLRRSEAEASEAKEQKQPRKRKRKVAKHVTTENCFEIKGKLPSLNEYVNACRKNKFAGSQFKKKIQDKIVPQILQALSDDRLKPIKKPCIIYMTFTETSHRRDVDNIQSSQKFILDSLVNCQILPDDNPKWVKQIYHTIEYGNSYNCKVVIREE